MSFGSVGDWLAVGAAPFTGGASLLGSDTIRGGLGNLVSGIGKVGLPGQDTTRPATFGETPQYNPNAFNYGGVPGGADGTAKRYQWQSDQAQGRAAPQANYDRANQWDNAAGVWDGRNQAARGGQDQVAGLMMNRATGATPSIAGMQARQDIGLLQQNSMEQSRAAQAAQGAQMASARGGAGVALAGQTAANNIANAQGAIGYGSAQATQNISNQAQINAANERLQAEGAASNAYGAMRLGDTANQNSSLQAMSNAAQMAQYQALLQQNQGAENDKQSLGYSDLENRVQQGQLNAQVTGQNILAGSVNSLNSGLMNQGTNNANNQVENEKMILGAVSGKMGTPTPKAAGGPVHAGGLYLVGERGPELMVPQRSGTVIPNHQIRGLY